jgi:hypothetical protein
LLTFGLSFAALTTYWDWLFGYDNFYFNGFMCGLAAIPLLWAGVSVGNLAIRLITSTLGMGLWSKWVGSDVQEEFGRGVLFII